MGKFIISGGKPLVGKLFVGGSKNAALPIIFASLITHGVSEIRNLPDITDVKLALEIIEGFGAVVERRDGVVYISTESLSYSLPDVGKVARLRASTYLIGAGLARFGRAELQSFGGCNFSKRPIDMHLSAAMKFGARTEGNALLSERLGCADIFFEKKSVGATVNAIIMAASAEGTSRIYGYAEEPHVFSLIEYLRSAGALINESGGALYVSGGRLNGGRITVPGDMIEAGTFLAASLITGGEISVGGFDSSELTSFLSPLVRAGVKAVKEGGEIRLLGEPDAPMEIITSAYPGFPTDLQPIFALILARFHGGMLTETVWPGRFGYLRELNKLGVRYDTDGVNTRIYRSDFRCGIMRATDLRGGAAGILAALAACGESEILSAELVKRGYERIEEKLKLLCADAMYIDCE